MEHILSIQVYIVNWEYNTSGDWGYVLGRRHKLNNFIDLIEVIQVSSF